MRALRIALVAIAVLAAACSEQRDPTGASGNGTVVEIELTNYAFTDG